MRGENWKENCTLEWMQQVKINNEITNGILDWMRRFIAVLKSVGWRENQFECVYLLKERMIKREL